MLILLEILLILVVSRLVGELMERFNQPALVGEILVGIVLGPALLHWLVPGNNLKIVADLAIFFIVFTVGIEFSLGHIKKHYAKALGISFMSNNIAFFAGILMAFAFGYSFKEAFFIGTVFSLTALPVALRMLADMRKDKTELGTLIITVSIFDDIFSFFLLAFALPIGTAQEISPIVIGTVAIKIAVFLLIIFAIDRFFKWRYELPSRYFMHYIRKFRSREAEFAVILMFGLIFAFAGEFLGITYIIGTFYAGALIGVRVIGERVYNQVKNIFNSITYGFLAPIFFVYIGLNFIVDGSNISIANFIIVSTIFIIFAFVGKTLGAYVGGRLSGVKDRTSKAVGIALNSRGIMGLVIAEYGLQLGIIKQDVFSLLLIVSMATTLMTPLLLGRYLKKYPEIDNLEL